MQAALPPTMPEQAVAAELLGRWRTRVDRALMDALPAATLSPQRLHAAMRHAVLLGGKRMRPLLAYATAHVLGADADALDLPGAALELIHAYSLVHDDLPAMDDDVLRRGQPTVHVAFDQATAILSGDALQALAFELLATAPFDATTRVAMVHELARAAGAGGMCGGQALDIAATGLGDRTTLSALELLHAGKTGALLRASVRFGALAAAADETQQARLDDFAADLGLAFQIRDDLLDVQGHTEAIGKTAGKDQAGNKATFPALIGVTASEQRLRELADAMQQALCELDGDAAPLRELARIVVQRNH